MEACSLLVNLMKGMQSSSEQPLGLIVHKVKHIPLVYSYFPKCLLRCSLAQTNFFAMSDNARGGSCLDDSDSWYFYGRFLGDVGKETCARKSPMPQVMSNTIVAVCGNLLVAFW